MRRLAFPLGLLTLALFEAAAVWFVMPLPGSQRVRSVEFAFTLHSLRWPIRALCLAMAAWGMPASSRTEGVTMVAATATEVASDRLVVGVVVNGEARAYPLQFIGYHHFLTDTLAGRPIVLVVAADSASFFAFERPSIEEGLLRDGDSLRAGSATYGFSGHGPVDSLRPIRASQGFWHSWRSFHALTTRFP